MSNYTAINRKPKQSLPQNQVLEQEENESSVINKGSDLPNQIISGRISADEILSQEWPEPEWAVPGILPVGLGILAGPPKVGKSWLALQIAQAVAAGGRALDEKVERGPVLYLALEDPERRLKERMQMQGWQKGLLADFMSIGKFADNIGDLRNGGVGTLSNWIEEDNYRLVVIDTLSRAIQGDQGDVREMTNWLTPLQELAHSQNTAIVLVDHHRKVSGFDANAVGDILGSTAKGAMADTILSMYREQGKSGAKLIVIGREIEETKLKIRFDRQTGCWQNEGDIDDLNITKRRQEILDILENLGPSTNKQISDEIDQPGSNTHTRLQDLVSAGKVKRYKDEADSLLYALT